MEQKTTWICCSQHMNKFILILLLFLMSCEDRKIEEIEWDIDIKLTFINQSSYMIRTELSVNDGNIECSIPDLEPNDSYVYSFNQKHFGNRSSDKPSLDNISTLNKIYCGFFYGNTLKCSRKIGDARNYENGTQTGEFEFEYTYFFTNKEYEQAEDCN